MIIAEKLSKDFQGKAAVNDVSFELERGQRLVLLGSSGSGKTTTLRMLNRLVEPSSGNIFVNGRSILNQNAELLRRSMGYVLQHHGLFPHYTVEENISVVPRLLNWDKGKIRSRCVELLEKFHLPAEQILQMMPDQLSGGQQQRIGLARALAADPPILLMDEPFGALDPVIRTKIRRSLFQVDEMKEKTIVLVTHDVHEAFELGDQICLLHQGCVMQQGSAAELLFNPECEFVDNFFETHRLELELSILRIRDLWPFLDEPDLPVTDTGFNSENSLSEILDHFSKNETRKIAVFHKGHETQKTVTASGLFRALNQLRKSGSHG